VLLAWDIRVTVDPKSIPVGRRLLSFLGLINVHLLGSAARYMLFKYDSNYLNGIPNKPKRILILLIGISWLMELNLSLHQETQHSLIPHHPNFRSNHCTFYLMRIVWSIMGTKA
jgi:hypothetical protein